MIMENEEYKEEVLRRLSDKFTAAEVAEYLDIPVEELLREYWHRIPEWMLKEIRTR
jgi:hypothetical protein